LTFVAAAVVASCTRDRPAPIAAPVTAPASVAKTATVVLPQTARGAVHLEDDSSHLALAFALRGASDAPLRTADGLARYAGAIHGADVVHRVHADGTEDFVAFDARPPKEELVY